jgi:hypothetical protein
MNARADRFYCSIFFKMRCISTFRPFGTKDATMEMSDLQVLAEPEEGDLEDPAEVEVEVFSRLDNILMIYVQVLNICPLFAVLLFFVPDDAEFHLQRALIVSSVLFFFYLLAMVRLHRTQQYAVLQTLYWVLLLYVDTTFPVLGVLLLAILSKDSKDDEPSVFSQYALVSITLAAWLILDLIVRGGIFRTHDYTFEETMTQDRDARLYAILKRGLDENDYRYKYIPKTHVQLMCCAFIFIGTTLCGIVMPTLLTLTIPVAVLCIVDMCYHQCCVDHEDDPDESTIQDSGADETTTQQPDEAITPEIV